jgi:hypothetical protein
MAPCTSLETIPPPRVARVALLLLRRLGVVLLKVDDLLLFVRVLDFNELTFFFGTKVAADVDGDIDLDDTDTIVTAIKRRRWRTLLPLLIEEVILTFNKKDKKKCQEYDIVL